MSLARSKKIQNQAQQENTNFTIGKFPSDTE